MDPVDLEAALIARSERLSRYIESKIHVRYRTLVSADDVLQRIWADAFKWIGQFVPDGAEGFDRWLRTLTDRRIVDAVRIARALKRHPGGLIQDSQASRQPQWSLLAQMASPNPSPSQELWAKETVGFLQQALDRLAEPRRRVVIMRYVEGLSVAAIAEALDKSQRAIHSLLFRALNDLRDEMGSVLRFYSDAQTDRPESSPPIQL